MIAPNTDLNVTLERNADVMAIRRRIEGIAGVESVRTAPLPPLLTKTQLAQYLQVTTRQIDNLRHTLPQRIMIGFSPRWRTDQIQDWLEQQH